MASCSNDQSIIIWSLEQSKLKESGCTILKSFSEHDHVIEALVFAPENSCKVIINSEYGKKIFRKTVVNSLEGEEEKKGTESKIRTKKLVAAKLEEEKEKKGKTGKQFLASGSRDKLIKIWEIDYEDSIITLKGHDDWVRDVVFTPDGKTLIFYYHIVGKYLISASDDKTIRIWDLNVGRCLKQLADAHDQFITSVHYNLLYPLVASGDVNNNIKIWECN